MGSRILTLTDGESLNLRTTCKLELHDFNKSKEVYGRDTAVQLSNLWN